MNTNITSNLTAVDILTASLVASIAYGLSNLVFRKNKKDGIPYLHSQPVVGCVEQIFKSPTAFVTSNLQKHGTKFYARVLKLEWLFVLDPVDVKMVLRLPNKTANSFEGFMDLFGHLFPQDGELTKFPEIVQVKLSTLKTPTTPHIAHSVRAPVLKEWVPAVRKVIRDALQEEPEGKLDLFDFCRRAISGITTLVMLGEAAFQDKETMKMWMDLFQEAELEKGMGEPISAVKSMVEVAIFGERRIYQRVRKLLRPLVDAEVEACVTGKPLPKAALALATFVRFRFQRDFGGNAEHLEMAKTRISNNMFNFSTAAFSNSFAGAAWTLYHILRDTGGVGTKIRSDLKDATSVNELNPISLQHAVYEVTRIYTPGYSLRKIKNDIVLPTDGTVVKAGTNIVINHFLASRQGYTNPLSFDPSRVERKEDKENIFMGYGMGTHPCVGKHLAMLEIGIMVQECMACDLRLIPPLEVHDANFMDTVIDIPDHPSVEKSQSAFLWRPENPVYVEYRK